MIYSYFCNAASEPRNRMRKETLVSIAERIGCSVSTVSRVLNGNAVKYRISETMSRRILDEARRANYTPSLLAKGLRTNKTSTIGLVIPNIENTFFANIAGVIIREARSLNYKVVVADTQENESYEKDGLSSLLARHVDGIIVAPCGNDPSIVENVLDTGIPIVQIDRYISEALKIPYISTDNYKGAVMAVEHLIENGHENIACIQGPPQSMPAGDRTRGFFETMAEHGIQGKGYLCGDEFSLQNGYLETKLLLSGPNPPTAIFAQSNLILLGAIKAIFESGLKIPDDISIISFDDNVMFNYLNPAITCIAQPIEEIGILAVKILMKSIQEDIYEASHIHLPPTLIVRNSVRKIV